jgi:hypothetical protein
MAAALPFIIAGVSAYGAIQQGQQQQAALQQQANQAQRDKDALVNQARVARQQAGAEEESQRREARQLLATQRAAIGQSGASGGTLGLLQEDSEMQAELDALNIRYGGEQQASNLLSQANEAGISSGILKGNASQASRAGYLGAGAGLLSSGASLYSKYKKPAGVNTQGQNVALTNNAAYVKNM